MKLLRCPILVRCVEQAIISRMSDAEAREALRGWENNPQDRTAGERALAACRRERMDPPWLLLATSSRWSGAVDLVAQWFEVPLTESDGTPWEQIVAKESQLQVRLPDVVREWYRLLGGRPGVCAGSDEPVDLADLEVEEDRLVLSRGHQGIGEWFVRLSDSQPEVLFDLEGDEGPIETLETFYFRLLLNQVGQVYTPPAGLSSSVHRWLNTDGTRIRPLIHEHFEQVGGPRLLYESRMVYVGQDTIIVDDGEGYGDPSFAVRTETAGQHLRDLLGTDGWQEDWYLARARSTQS